MNIRKEFHTQRFICVFLFILAEGNGNYQIDEGQCNVGTLMRIPRADVAHFMLKALGTKQYDRKCLAIASNYEQPS